MGSQGLNGSAETVPLDDPLARHVAELEGMLPALAAEREQIEAHLTAVRDREERIRMGIAALVGKVKPPPSKALPLRRAETGKGKSAPSQRLQDNVYAIIASSAEPLSIAEISDRAGVTRSAIDNAVAYLRELERVRVAGKQGLTRLYATMPS